MMAGRGHGHGRVLVVALILVAEWVALSWVYDARTLARPGGPFDILRGAGNVVPLVAVMAFASLLVGRSSKPSAEPPVGVPVLEDGRSGTRVMVGVLLHVGAMVALVMVTSAAARSAPWVLESPSLTLALWLAAALGTALSLVFAAWAPAQLWAVARRSRLRDVLFVVGLTVGAWMVAGICRDLWMPLRASTMGAVELAVRLGGMEVVSDPATALLGTPRFVVVIAPVCSGLQGIGLLMVLVVGHLWHQRGRLAMRRAWLLVPGAVVLGFALNVVRITALIAIGHHVSPEIAIGGFHAKAGWILLCAAAVGLVLLIERNAWFRDPQTPVEPVTTTPANAAVHPYLLPMVAGLGGALVLQLLVADARASLALPPLKIIAATVAVIWLGKRLPVRAWPLPSIAVIAGLATAALWLGLRSLEVGGFATPAEPVLHPWQGTTAIWTTMRLVGAVVVSPLVEELAFRGYLARRLMAARFEHVDPTTLRVIAIVGSSVVFGVLHSAWLAATAAGLVYALVYRRTGRLSDAIVAHAVTNATLVIVGTLTGDPAMWLT